MSSEYIEYVTHDLLAHIPGIRARQMFGGHGIYKDGVIVAFVVDDEIYFKVDDTNRGRYEVAGSSAFEYSRRGRVMKISYWKAMTEDRYELERMVMESYSISLKKKSGAA